MSTNEQNEPPAEHRFKPGQSGNPKGRPKGAKNKKNRKPRLRKDPLLEKIDYPVNGKLKRISRGDALILSARDRALKERNDTLEQLLLNLDDVLAEAQSHVDYNSWHRLLVSQADHGWHHPEGVLCAMGMMRLLYRDHPLARMAIEPWVVELAVARLAPGSLSYEEQKLVVAATRLARKVKWPDWWDPRLRKRPRDGYRLLLDEEIRWNGGKRI